MILTAGVVLRGRSAPEQAILEILKLADPDAYGEVEARLREARGLRHVRKADTETLYDVMIVVGGGPRGTHSGPLRPAQGSRDRG